MIDKKIYHTAKMKCKSTMIGTSKIPQHTQTMDTKYSSMKTQILHVETTETGIETECVNFFQQQNEFQVSQTSSSSDEHLDEMDRLFHVNSDCGDDEMEEFEAQCQREIHLISPSKNCLVFWTMLDHSFALV